MIISEAVSRDGEYKWDVQSAAQGAHRGLTHIQRWQDHKSFAFLLNLTQGMLELN